MIDQKTFDVILEIQVNKLARTLRYKRKNRSFEKNEGEEDEE